MNTISFSIDGTDYEQINIVLTDTEVATIYKAHKELTTKNKELVTDYERAKRQEDYYYKLQIDKQTEIDSMHALLTALGIPETYKPEGAYSDLKYSLNTRMALFLANRNSAGT